MIQDILITTSRIDNKIYAYFYPTEKADNYRVYSNISDSSKRRLERLQENYECWFNFHNQMINVWIDNIKKR